MVNGRIGDRFFFTGVEISAVGQYYLILRQGDDAQPIHNGLVAPPNDHG
jgi:hypothetical protein